MSVVAKSPDFVLRDGAKVIPVASPFTIFRVERVVGDRVRLYSSGREGDARASEVVRLDQAETYFSALIKARPQAAYGYLMRATVRRFHHDLTQARLDCEEAVRLEDTNPWAYFVRGSIAARQRDSKNAIVDFEKVIRLDARIAIAHIALADCHLSARDYDKALVALNEATRLDPTILEACLLRGAIWAEKGDRRKAIRQFDEAIRLDPKWARARAARAAYYRSIRKFDKALADANEAIRLDPTDGGRYLTRARIAFEMGNMDKAIADLDEAIRLNPRDVRALVARANCFLERNEIEKGQLDLDEALRIDPKADEALRLRAEMVLQSGGDSAKALEYLNWSIQSNPGNPYALVTRAAVYIGQGKLSEAFSDVETALKIEPGSGDAWNTHAAILLLKRQKGESPGQREFMLDLGRGTAVAEFPAQLEVRPILTPPVAVAPDPDVLSDLNEAIRVDPTNTLWFNNRGRLFARARAFTKARADFNRAIALDPDDPTAYINRCSLFLLQNEPDKALADINEVFRLNPDDREVYLHRAGIFVAKKEYRKAIDDVEEAIRLGAVEKAHLANARLRACLPDLTAEDRDRALESTAVACQLTGWKDVECIMAAAAIQAELGAFDEAILTIREATSQLDSGDKRMKACRAMEESFLRKKTNR